MSGKKFLFKKMEHRIHRRADELTRAFSKAKSFTRIQFIKLIKDTEIFAELAGRYPLAYSEPLEKFIERPCLNKFEIAAVKRIFLDYARAMIT